MQMEKIKEDYNLGDLKTSVHLENWKRKGKMHFPLSTRIFTVHFCDEAKDENGRPLKVFQVSASGNTQ